MRSPLGPLCEGAPPAGGGGENCTAVRNISGYGKALSLRPFGAPPSQREVFRRSEKAPLRGEPLVLWQSQNSFIGAAALGYLGQFPGFYKAFDAAVDQLVADAEVTLGKNFADELGSQEAASGGFA